MYLTTKSRNIGMSTNGGAVSLALDATEDAGGELYLLLAASAASSLGC
jgi:hypothetical protein